MLTYARGRADARAPVDMAALVSALGAPQKAASVAAGVLLAVALKEHAPERFEALCVLVAGCALGLALLLLTGSVVLSAKAKERTARAGKAGAK